MGQEADGKDNIATQLADESHWDDLVIIIVVFVSDVTKYIIGCMASLSAMIQPELPHISVLTKVDLLPNKRDIDRFLDPHVQLLFHDSNANMAPRFRNWYSSIISFVVVCNSFEVFSFLV